MRQLKLTCNSKNNSHSSQAQKLEFDLSLTQIYFSVKSEAENACTKTNSILITRNSKARAKKSKWNISNSSQTQKLELKNQNGTCQTPVKLKSSSLTFEMITRNAIESSKKTKWDNSNSRATQKNKNNSHSSQAQKLVFDLRLTKIQFLAKNVSENAVAKTNSI